MKVVTKTATDQLPSLPQVLVRILDAIRNDNTDYQSIAEIIRQDGGVATKLITVANSSFYGRPKSCESIERALLFLGTDVVKTIAITTSIKQFFGHFNQQHRRFLQQFWRRSLISANFAQVLATLTSYPSPDEAYLCGLLVDVGQLMSLTSNEKSYLDLLDGITDDQQLLAAEEQKFGRTHCQIGAELVDSWNISSFMGDAVRYHHEPANLVLDAHHLVKIINLASLLSSDGELDDQALAAADTLFGLNESLTRELRSRIDSDVDAIAHSLNIDISNDDDTNNKHHQDAHYKLGQHLSELGELAQVTQVLSQAESREGLQQAAQRALFLTLGISNCVLFFSDDTETRLHAEPEGTTVADDSPHPPIFEIPIEPGRSLISDALLDGKEKTTATVEHPISVIDRQILRYCQSDILVCWPLELSNAEANEKVGVLVFACDKNQLAQLGEKSSLTKNLCSEVAIAITTNYRRLNEINAQQPSTEHYLHQINEVIHEASNPLSIIRNYLEILRIKLGEEHSANESLGLIKEEIDRVGNILLRLKDPEEEETNPNRVSINNVIESTSIIFQNSICETKNIKLLLTLDKNISETPGNPEHLKQILTNLLKNATEALSAGNTITVTSEASVSFGGKSFVAVYIEDDGPGITDEVKHKLFSPVESTKGKGHSGLGLSIVKKLLDEMNGTILCRSTIGKGTEFQILLPKN
ncbi:MAG: HDOD domain-containing protein [Oceanicoccus sp.]